jgi:hypothetical protein
MISFDKLGYSKIPIWENKHRIEYLTVFRDFANDIRPAFNTQPRIPVSPTTGKPFEQGQRYTEFNERKPLAHQMILLAGIKTRREFAARVKGNSSLIEVDVIEQYWSLETLGVSFRAPQDIIEEAIGRYKTDQKKAQRRTWSPLFWAARFIEWIIQFPVWLISLTFSIEEEKVARSWYGRLLSGIYVGFCTLIPAVQALSALLDHFGLERPLLHLLGFPTQFK